jgi:Fe-S-cluster-containing hydrogenase component 2
MKHRYLKNVATLRLSAEKCIGCGRCTEVCPHRVFSVNEKKAKNTAEPPGDLLKRNIEK